VRIPLRARFSAFRHYGQASKVTHQARTIAENAQARREQATTLRVEAQQARERAAELDAAAEEADHSAAGRYATADRLRAAGESIEETARHWVLEHEQTRREHAAARERRAAQQREARERAAAKAAAGVQGVEREAAERLRLANEARERALREVDSVVSERKAEVARTQEAYYKAVLAEGEAVQQREATAKAQGQVIKQVDAENAAAARRARVDAETAARELAQKHAGELKKLTSKHESKEREIKGSLKARIEAARNAQTVE